MQVENNLEKKIQWKSVSPRVSVTNYSSVTKSSGYGSSKIFVKHIKALKEADGPRVSLFLLHDLGQHHGRFQKFIDWVMKEHPSYSIFCIDFVGHGSSSGTRGHFEKFDDLASDVHLLFQEDASHFRAPGRVERGDSENIFRQQVPYPGAYLLSKASHRSRR
jgi:alpha-beta hydrolase superfamily lysophospholipase